MAKSDCRGYQHLNRAHLLCRRYYKGIEDPDEEEACEDFVPLLWELDYTKKKLADLK